ncbi:hypothetical protein L226DRAFT_593407 [Lentinus tigrinus ALCF2SS1-7]|uniref:uncharacterized protein n=1 Tax=Lentinus tigrinus ALCF2SS1-7 TaxID=1328758 RepID=UPI001165C88E|nr:hypothetical protein L226DRAFT_593407 [Lentinus tigrinus ALCF2SS1-7]
MRRTSASYFGFCNAHHIPDITDMVIVVLNVDDANSDAYMEEFELLIPFILIRPDAPAVLILGHFSPQLETPSFALTPAQHEADPDPHSIEKYFADPILANVAGHEVIADVLTSYFQTQVCLTWAAIMGHSAEALPSPAAPVYPDGQAKHPTDARGLFGGVAQRKGAAGAASPEDEQINRAAAGALPASVVSGDSSGRTISQEVGRRLAEKRWCIPSARSSGVGHLSMISKKTGMLFLPAVLFSKIMRFHVRSPSHPRLRVPLVLINSRPADLEDGPFEEVAPYCVSANDLVNPPPLPMFAGSGWAAYHPPPGSAELSSHAHSFYSSLRDQQAQLTFACDAMSRTRMGRLARALSIAE